MPPPKHPPLLTRAQLAEHDRIAVEELGVPQALLMENAGRGAAHEILDFLAGRHAQGPALMARSAWRVVILCGQGRNGGDGYALARHLHVAGLKVAVYTTGPADEMDADARVHRRIWEALGLETRSLQDPEVLEVHRGRWEAADALVDALLGTGFRGGTLRPLQAQVIQAANGVQRPRKVAIDVPSGLDCDTGEPSDACFRADLTVTFVASKRGFLARSAQAWLGRVVVVGVGLPAELVQRVDRPEDDGESA